MGAIERTDIAAYDYDAVAGYAYDEFAECTCDENLIGFDRETNLHYNGARDYDPGIGAYHETEPLGLAGDINLYRYARNNPLSYIDPDGNQAVIPGGGAAGGLGGLGGFGPRGSGGNGRSDPYGGLGQYLPGGSGSQSSSSSSSGSGSEQCKQPCSPCKPYPVGTIGFQGPEVGVKGRDAGISHYHLYQVEQIPSNCKCIWKERTKALAGAHHYYNQPNPSMAVDLNGSGRPPNYPH